MSKVQGSELFTLDLLIATPVLADVLAGRIRASWERLDIWIVSREGLAAMKRLAGRHQEPRRSGEARPR